MDVSFPEWDGISARMERIHVVKKIFALLCCCLAVVLAAAEKVAVVADKNEAKCGEKITFTVKVSGDKAAKRTVNIELMGNSKIRGKRKVVTDAEGVAKIEVVSNHPGSVCCLAQIKVDKKWQKAYAGVAIDKEKVVPGRPAPADFNEFWAKIKKELDARPMDAVLMPLKVNRTGVKAYKVILPMGGDGKDAYAKFSVPAGAKAKSLPAFLLVHGAGTGEVPVMDNMALRYGGMLFLTLSPMPADGRGNVYPARTGRFTGYRHWNADDRDKIYFKEMFCRVYRGLQFLKSRPEWNGKILIVSGTSQGGGQALAAGGLDPQVTLVTAHVPAICNHGGFAAGGDSGWPHYQNTPAYRKDPEAVLKASAYIDGVNFARNIKARVLITTGFIDRTCPPESVFAAFNVIPSARKELFCTPGANHRVPDVARDAAAKVWADHIKTGQ